MIVGSFVRAIRAPLLVAMSFAALAFAGCSNDNNSTGPTTQRVYNQVQRLGNPLVSEVFLEKRDHPWHGAIGPSDDVDAFSDKVKAFPAAFGRPAVVGNTLAAVLLPDMLIVQLDKDPGTVGWLSWALANGYGGRGLGDDVVDAGLTAIFGKLIDPGNALCDNFQLPLCTDNISDPHRYTGTFPYLIAPM